MTEGKVLRFSRGFGSINDVIKLKSFQIVKVSKASHVVLSYVRYGKN